MFLQYINKKSVVTAFVFYCDANHSDMLWESFYVHCYLLPGKSAISVLLKDAIYELFLVFQILILKSMLC